MRKYFFLLLAFASHLTFSQNWTGAVNADWNNAANWSSTPSNGDDLLIDPANYTGAMAQPVISTNSIFTTGEVLIQNGAHLTIAANLTCSDRVEVFGDGTLVTMNSGTLLLNGPGGDARLIFAEDSHFQMEGGTLTIGQRLLFELGGSGEINAGTITVGETIALVDGSATASSQLVQNGGIITTNAEFGFENEAGIFYPTFSQTAGELHINGALLWLGVTPGAGRGYFESTGGTIYITGNISNDPLSTMGMDLSLSNNAILTNTGATVDLLSGDSVSIADNATWLETSAVSWTNEGVFYATGTSLFQAGNTTLNGSGFYQFDDLLIPVSKLLNQITPASISISGDVTVNGTLNANSNQLILNGDDQQTINATAAINLYDLEVANSTPIISGDYGITLNSDLNISNQLELTDGIVQANSLATIWLADNATVNGGTDTTFVDGFMEKSGNDAFTFPVGAVPDRYRPLTISAPVNTATLVRLIYEDVAYSILTPVETPLQSVSAIEYWDLSRTGSTDLFAVTVGWNNAAQSGLTDCADISMTSWNGSQWSFVPSTTTGLCAGSNAGTLESASALPFIGPLTIGFTENVYQNQVTVCNGESVVVGSNTYNTTGVYTDLFTDINGDDSIVVTILYVNDLLSVNVSNNIDHLMLTTPNADSYQWIDCTNGNAPITGETGTSFYPAVNGSYAVIVTKNGCSDTSACYTINQLSTAEIEMTNAIVLYPNPVNGSGTLNLVTAETLHKVEIVTLDGRKIFTHSPVTQNQFAEIELNGLTPGTYFLVVTNASDTVTAHRFVVK